MSIRPAMSGKFDRKAIYYREQPARRLGVILSTLFLVSLATIASVTTVRARNGDQGGARVTIVAPPASTTP